MATSLSDYANLLLTYYGKLIAAAFTQAGQDGEGTINPNSMFGRIRSWGNVQIGTGEVSDVNAFDWGVDTTAETAIAYGAGDTYTADGTPVFGAASLAWKRQGIPMSWDDLQAVLNAPLRDGANSLDSRMKKKLRALVAKIEADLATDGTGTSSKDLTGLLAFLSVGNTYAGINQVGNTYWQASIVTAGAALAKSHLQNLTGALWDKEVITPDSHEFWMGRAVWNQYVALYPATQTFKTDKGGDSIAAYYEDGMVDLPIVIMPNMPAGEIWCLDKRTISLRFADQSPKHGINAADAAVGEVMHEGVPIGIKYVPEASDTTSLWLRSYSQAGCTSPRNSGAIVSIS